MRSTIKSLPQSQIDRLVGLFNAGRYQELEVQSRTLLQRYPNSGFVWKSLSLALYSQGKEALPALRRAAELLPDDAEAHSNLGAVLKYLGHLDGAAASFRQAQRIRPGDAVVTFNLAVTLYELGQLDDSVRCLHRVLAINPGFSEALLCLGNGLLGLGQLDQAVASYRQALDINPDYAEAFCNQGKAQLDMGLLDEAEASCRRAIQIKPDYSDAYINLGNALKALGQADEAVVNYRRALEIKPDSALASNNLGKALEELGQLTEAIESYHRASVIKPDYAEAYFNLGSAQEDLGQLEESVASYSRALEINPVFFAAFVNLGHVLEASAQLERAVSNYRKALEIDPRSSEAHCNLGNALRDSGKLGLAVESFRKALEIEPDHADAHSNLLFIHGYLSTQEALVLMAEARQFGVLAAKKSRRYLEWQNAPEPDRQLRVGFVSGDLGNHPVGFFVESMLAHLSANTDGRLELIAYPCLNRTDKLADRIKSYCHGWNSAVGLSDEKLAQQIWDDRIDILIDLAGHTAHNRLPMFAWKPAPVQVSWLGYFATTGLAEMDYLLADPWTVPLSEEAHFTETIWRMPESYLCFTPPDFEIQVCPLPSLASRVFTFGCFNNVAKMSDAVVALWARVLRAVPDSRLFLKTGQLVEPFMQQSVVQRFAVHGIEATRLILEGPSPRAELLAAYNRVDIALDPFPYPGGTTSAEALWMGVPVLTLAGDRFLSHIGESILQNAGLPDWIAVDADDYVSRAVAHASDIPRLAALRQGLRQQVLASPLFDAPRFARHFETALRGMWTNWCQQQEKLQ